MELVLLKKRDSQMIKGIAILAVMISHMSYIMTIPSKIEILIHPLGYLGVSLFLFVSGYGCVISAGNYKNKLVFLEHRLKKIVPMLALITVVSVLLNIYIYGCSYNYISIFLNAIGISNSISRFTWYITFQYFWYILFVILWIDHYKLYWFGALVVYVISFALKCPEIQFNMWGLNCISFPLGVYFALNQEQIILIITRKKRLILLFTFLSWVVLFAICYLVLGNPSDLRIQNLLKSLISGLFVILIVFIIYLYEKKIEKNLIKGLVFVGNISYELYLVHGFWVFLFLNFFEPEQILKIVFYIITSFSIAFLLHKIYKKYG